MTKDPIDNKENLHESKDENFHEKSSFRYDTQKNPSKHFCVSGWLNISNFFFSMAPSKNEDFMNQPPPQQQQQQTPQQTPIFEPPQQDFKFGMDYAAGYR